MFEIQSNAGACPPNDSKGEYRRRLTDDEVRALGYSHRDETGRWVHRRNLADARQRRGRARRAVAERCLTCGVDPTASDHLSWCEAAPSYTVGAALRDARDLEAAIKWEPKVQPRRLSPPEREQLNKLFAALVMRNQEGAA